MPNSLNRRDFLKAVSLGSAGMNALVTSSSQAKPDMHSRPGAEMRIGRPLRVKPVLVYKIYRRIEATSWREWGGVQTKSAVDAEAKRIEQELKSLASKVDFPVEVLPLSLASNNGQASAAARSECDVILVYAAGGGHRELGTLSAAGKPNIIFLRHKSGPIYLWYEIVHPAFLRQRSDEYKQPNVAIQDVVVDDYEEVLWRLRSLYGLENTLGTKIIAIEGASGWGAGHNIAPAKAKEIWKFDIQTVSHKELGRIFEKKMADNQALDTAERQMNRYLAQKSIISVETDKGFIHKAFILRNIFKELMAEAGAKAITLNQCMGIGTLVGTTVCLPWSLINDEGPMAFCESDFVVIPSGVLLRYISGRPVFFNDPTFPHDGVTTCAHCTAPRRMNGKDFEPTKILTHCESDYGAAPKVNFTKGQVVTNLVPDFHSKKWLGFTGEIIDHPSYHICRSQFDLRIDGDWRKLIEDMRGFHWMTCYGDYLREAGYALRKVGIEWQNITTGRESCV